MDINEFKSFLEDKEFSKSEYGDCPIETRDYHHLSDQLLDFVEENKLVSKIDQLEQMLIKLKSLKSIIEPNVYTTVFTERTGEKAILGKATIMFSDGTKKLISVYVGKESKFSSKEDPIAIEIAKQKIRTKIREMKG